MTKLIRLPHTGLRIPDSPRLAVTNLKMLETPCGVAWTATLLVQGVARGTVYNEGTGGPTGWQPISYTDGKFTPRDFDTILAECRDSDGEPINDETLLDELGDEYEQAREIRRLQAAHGASGGIVRLQGDYDNVLVTRWLRHPVPHDLKGRARLGQDLTRRFPDPDAALWQGWTGIQWVDLLRLKPRWRPTATTETSGPADDPKAAQAGA